MPICLIFDRDAVFRAAVRAFVKAIAISLSCARPTGADRTRRLPSLAYMQLLPP